MIIGVCGFARSGKDTFANIASEYLVNEEPGKKIKILHFAAPLKNACKLLFNLTDEQLYGDLKEVIDTRYNKTPREILQWLGSLLRNTFSKDIFVNITHENIQKAYNQGYTLIIIPDLRFDNEAEMIKNNGGKIVKISRDSVKPETILHESEIPINGKYLNYEIINNSSIELYNEIVKSIVCKILKSH